MKRVELLAPAGNLESFYSALNNGADAIYLGIDEFNARGNIQNFGLENIGAVIDEAHLFGVKIYVTLNILIKDSEMKEVLLLAEKLLGKGVDAFIVQDLGLAFAIKKTFPNAVLHASTQMGICNYEGALFVKKFGFSRVVLARETPLEEIKRIHDNLDIEIEYFVQGALCVAYSGNCYFSSLEGGASGNRGKCKQFCRLPYKLQKNNIVKEGYLLSAKDFCMLDRLDDLIESGVISLKIEGRARRAGYVGRVVDVYRKALDEKGFDKLFARQTLMTAFNRGDYIEGYFNDDKKIDSKVQGHRGLKIGKVIGFNKGKKFNVIIVQSNREINRGDGLKFIYKDKELASVGVNDVKVLGKDKYQITSLACVQIGADVCLTLDSHGESEVLEKQRKIKLNGVFNAKINEKASLMLKTLDNFAVQVFSDETLEESKTSPLLESEIFEQLTKGCQELQIDLQISSLEKVFMRKASLNSLRRKAIQEMKKKISEEYASKNLKPFKKTDYSLVCKDEKTSKSEIFIFSDFKDLKNVDKNVKLVISPKEYNLKEIKTFCDRFRDYEIYLSTPIFANQKDINLLKIIFNENPNLNICANNYYAFSLMQNRKILVSNNLNVFNSQTIKALKEENVKDIIISVESQEVLKNQGVNLYALENYNPVLMTLLHCPFKEHQGSTCQDCKYSKGYNLIMQNKRRLILDRVKLSSCQFSLITEEKLPFNDNYFMAKVLN